MVIEMKKIILLISLLIIAGCAQQKDFSYGLGEIGKINSKYNTTISSYPASQEQINSMLSDFSAIASLELETGKESFEYVIKFRTLNLEAEKFIISSNKYGDAGTTKHGFGCKQRPLIIESAMLRNSSALKGFEATSLLNQFIAEYPADANTAGLSSKDVLFLNATFYQIYNDAEKDSNVINNFCPKSRVLELYQEEFRKSTDYSEDYITNLDYETAAIIWKKLR